MNFEAPDDSEHYKRELHDGSSFWMKYHPRQRRVQYECRKHEREPIN